MVKITPIDITKGISGKLASVSQEYSATNKCSNRIQLA